MIGVDAATGVDLEGLAHLRQSVADILTTPLGSRVMRRDYGSELPDLIDQPANPAQRLRVVSAAVTALARWEPRLILDAATLTPPSAADGAAGLWSLHLVGTYVDDTTPADGTAVDLSLPLGA